VAKIHSTDSKIEGHEWLTLRLSKPVVERRMYSRIFVGKAPRIVTGEVQLIAEEAQEACYPAPERDHRSRD
jgi:hypothetical protein